MLVTFWGEIVAKASSVLAGQFWQTLPELKRASFAPEGLLLQRRRRQWRRAHQQWHFTLRQGRLYKLHVFP